MTGRLKMERSGRNMTREDLAILAGVTSKTISNWESSRSSIPSKTVNRLCDLFGCSADWLLGRSEVRSRAD